MVVFVLHESFYTAVSIKFAISNVGIGARHKPERNDLVVVDGDVECGCHVVLRVRCSANRVCKYGAVDEHLWALLLHCLYTTVYTI